MRLRATVYGAVLLVAAAASADEADVLKARLDATAPSIAVVKCVLHMRWNSEGTPGENESPMEDRAAIVDPSGILVVAGSSVGADSPEQSEWREKRPGSNMKTTAENLRVIFPPDATEHPAAVLLFDARLRLAFVQVLELGSTKLPAVDLSQGAAPRLGQTLVGVTRDTQAFGNAPGIWTLYAAGKIETPSAAWIAAGQFNALGLPVFALDGKPAGVLSQLSSVEGAADPEEATTRTVILPLESVTKSLEAARKKLPEVLARVEAEKKAAAAAAKEPEPPKKEEKKDEETPKEPAAPAPAAPEPSKPPEQPK